MSAKVTDLPYWLVRMADNGERKLAARAVPPVLSASAGAPPPPDRDAGWRQLRQVILGSMPSPLREFVGVAKEVPPDFQADHVRYVLVIRHRGLSAVCRPYNHLGGEWRAGALYEVWSPDLGRYHTTPDAEEAVAMARREYLKGG